ncbi:unnamed protein product [Camellia sinensis]
MANPEHPRLIIHDFLSLDLCKELGFIHKSCGTVGYRANVFSTTLSHLIATNCAHLIMPFVPIRERLKEKVEEFFGCEFELFVEFTGLISRSWSRGASIGWHSDDNRPYLKQRDFAVYGKDFKGGLFHFQDWEPTTIVPVAGITPITQGAPERMLLAVPKVEPTKSWKDALLSPATQGAPERKLLAVPKVTGVTKKVTLLQKAESLRKITEDYVKASKQYAMVRATARTKNFLIQAKEANQFATTTFVAASTGATKNVVAQLLKRVEDSIKMVESAQKKASVENMAIIRAIGKRVMTQTPVDVKKAPVVEKTVAAYEPIVLFRAQNRSNQISVNSQEPKEHSLARQGLNKEHSLARQGSNEKHPLARQNKEHPLARQGSNEKHPLARQNKEHLLAQRDLNQHQLTRSKNEGTVLKIHEKLTKAQAVPSMPLGARLDMSSGPVSKRQRRRRNKALKKLELRTVAINVIGAIERALSKDEPQKQIESPVFVGKSKVEEGKQPLGNISTLVELSMEGIRKGPVTRSITRQAQNKASQSDASNMNNVVGVDNPLYEQDDSISFVSTNIGNNELKDINKVAVMMTEVEKEGENSQAQQDQGLKEKVVALQEQLERKEREMDVVMYTADSRNIHSVDEITDGERLTLTLWFSRDGSHDEDAKLISFLSQSQLHRSIHESHLFLPLPASTKMYWFPPEQASTYESGCDICFARIHALGYDLCFPQDKSCLSALDTSNDFSETLMEPLRLTRGEELLDVEFVNILHVLQAVQFYCWKSSELQTFEHEKKINMLPLSQSQREEVNGLKCAFLKDEQLAETLFRTCEKCEQHRFNWAGFSAAVAAWEAYCNTLVSK